MAIILLSFDPNRSDQPAGRPAAALIFTFHSSQLLLLTPFIVYWPAYWLCNAGMCLCVLLLAVLYRCVSALIDCVIGRWSHCQDSESYRYRSAVVTRRRWLWLKTELSTRGATVTLASWVAVAATAVMFHTSSTDWTVSAFLRLNVAPSSHWHSPSQDKSGHGQFVWHHSLDHCLLSKRVRTRFSSCIKQGIAWLTDFLPCRLQLDACIQCCHLSNVSEVVIWAYLPATWQE